MDTTEEPLAEVADGAMGFSQHAVRTDPGQEPRRRTGSPELGRATGPQAHPSHTHHPSRPRSKLRDVSKLSGFVLSLSVPRTALVGVGVKTTAQDTLETTLAGPWPLQAATFHSCWPEGVLPCSAVGDELHFQ